MSSRNDLLIQEVIGLYGISGSGKSYLIAHLKDSNREWRCVEGSDEVLKAAAMKNVSFIISYYCYINK